MPTQPRQPTLLYVVTVDWWFALHRLHVAQAAQAAGYHVVVATDVDRHGDELRRAGLRVVPLALDRQAIGPLRATAELASLISIYRRVRPDLVHHLALKPSVLGTLAADLTRTRPVVNTIAGMGTVFSEPSPLRKRLLRRAVLLALRLTLNRPRSRTIVENSDDRGMLVARAGVPDEKLVLIRSTGVDPHRFPAAPEPAGVPVVRLAARLIEAKGVEDFVAAARLLRGRGVPVRMQLVGAPDPASRDSVTEERLRAWVEEGVVEWLGWQTDMHAVWAAANLAVLPSYYREGVPTSLLEAAATGRAIVTTDVPGCRDAVAPGVSGLLVAPRDPTALAAAIEELAGSPGRRAAMGAAGRDRVLAGFTRQRVQEATLGVYRELLGDEAPAAGR